MDIIFAPFAWVWDLVDSICKLTGRTVAFVIGLVLLIVSVMLFLSIAGICLSVPFAGIGFLLVVRAIF